MRAPVLTLGDERECAHAGVLASAATTLIGIGITDSISFVMVASSIATKAWFIAA
jgi:hypothetical protein